MWRGQWVGWTSALLLWRAHWGEWVFQMTDGYASRPPLHEQEITTIVEKLNSYVGFTWNQIKKMKNLRTLNGEIRYIVSCFVVLHSNASRSCCAVAPAGNAITCSSHFAIPSIIIMRKSSCLCQYLLRKSTVILSLFMKLANGMSTFANSLYIAWVMWTRNHNHCGEIEQLCWIHVESDEKDEKVEDIEWRHCWSQWISLDKDCKSNSSFPKVVWTTWWPIQSGSYIC